MGDLPTSGWTADDYLDAAIAAELQEMDGRAERATAKLERLQRKYAALRNWGPLRYLRGESPESGAR